MQELPIRLGVGQLKMADPARLRFIKQMGVNDVIFHSPPLPGDKRYEFIDLLNLRTACEDAGLRLGAIENVPKHFYPKATLGKPGRDEEIENYIETIRNVGRAGIPILGYNFKPAGVWRTSKTTPIRGGAISNCFDYETVKDAPPCKDRVYTEAEMWSYYEYFIKAVMPAAEEAGVILALHPDDPPLESLGGIPKLFRNIEGYRRAFEIAPSPYHQIDFCQGCFAEMEGDVLEAIRYFGKTKRIAYVHFRDVQGTPLNFTECFINEGKTDMFAAMKTYHEVGFKGIMIPDHVPQMEGDEIWPERGNAYTIGYMTALLELAQRS